MKKTPAGTMEPRRTPSPFCPRDTQAILDALAELPTYYLELSHKSKGASGPIGLALTGLTNELHLVLCGWHELTRDAAGTVLDTQLRRAARYEVEEACKFLHGNVGVLVRLDAAAVVRAGGIRELDGVEAGLEVLALHTRASAALRQSRASGRAPVAC
jgi:hypothetical protein